jgi:predicted methyltransferase
MIRRFALSLLILAAPVAAQAKAGPNWLSAPGRAETDIQRDADRKPVEVLRFLGVKKGQAVLDYMAGGGYYAEIMAQAVGKSGKVTAWNPAGFVAAAPAQEKWAGLTGRNPNIRHVTAAFDGFDAPEKSFDIALLHLVYHDLYWQSDEFKVPRTEPDAVIGRLFKAMKKGGIVGIVDHAGPAGDTRQIVDTLHRISPETVKADFVRAGFRLVGESAALHVAGDDHTKNVFDPAIRGKTDRFILKFVKP